MKSLVTASSDRVGIDTKRGHSLAPFVITASCLVCVTLATVCRWPLVWCDEPYFVDPAFHLAEDGVFTSEISGRYGRQAEPPPPRLWAGNCPLYSIVTGYWLRVFGFSLFAARALNVVAYTGAVVLLALALRRLGFLDSWPGQVAFPVLMYGCYSLVFEYRQCRYDALCILECAAIFFSLTLTSPAVRHGALGVIAILLPWSGFPAVAWMCALFGVGAVLFGRRLLVDGLFFAMGIAAGLASLAAWLQWHDAFDIFFQHVNTVQGRVGLSVGARTRLLLKNLLEDRGRMALWCATFVIVAARVRRRSLTLHSPITIAACCTLAGAVFLVTVTTRAYSWMIAIPLIIGVVMELGGDGVRAMALPEKALAWAFAGVASLGLPGVLFASAYEWRERDHARVESFIASHIDHADYVFCDITGYFPSRRIARRVMVDFGTLYTVGIWDNVEEEAKLGSPFTAMIVRPERVERTIREFGGRWHEVARLPRGDATWAEGSGLKSLIKSMCDMIYPPPLDDDANKRIATDHMYDLVVLRPDA